MDDKIKYKLKVAGYSVLCFLVGMATVDAMSLVKYITGLSAVMSAIITDSAFIIIFGFLYFYARRIKKDEAYSIKSEFSVKKGIKLVIYSFFIGMMMPVVHAWASEFFEDAVMEARHVAMESSPEWQVLILTCIFAPIAEECVFRLFLYNFVKKRTSWLAAMIITSVAFGAAHLTMSHLIVTSIFGLFACLIYESTGLFFASILFHMFYNAMIKFFPYYNDMGHIVWFIIFTLVLLIMVSIHMFVVNYKYFPDGKVGKEVLKAKRRAKGSGI